MSTKIYNGYNLGNISFNDVKEFCIKINPILKAEQKQLVSKLAAIKCANIIDNLQYGLNVYNYFKKDRHNKKFTNKIFYEVQDQIQEEHNNIIISHSRNPQYDFGIEILFIPLKNKILALYYSEQSSLESIWNGFEEVNYYGYWDNTDQDETCTEEEWLQREKDWDEALPGWSVPAENGFSYRMLTDLPRYGVEQIINNIPNKHIRASGIASELMWNKYYNDNKIYSTQGQSLDLYFEFRQKQTRELANKYVEMIAKIKSELKTITSKDITKEIEFDFTAINSIDEL
jgi:hypothetical protein